MVKVKTHFVFPKTLLRDIDQIAGERKRSQFVVEAAKEKLEREQRRKYFHDAKGSWKENDYPDSESWKILKNGSTVSEKGI